MTDVMIRNWFKYIAISNTEGDFSRICKCKVIKTTQLMNREVMIIPRQRYVIRVQNAINTY